MKEHSIEVPGLLFSVSFGFLAKIVARRLRQRFSLATHTQCLWLRCAGLVGLLFLCSLVETTWGQPVLAPSEPTSAPRPEQDAAALAPPGVASSADANLLSDLTAREHPWGRFQPKSWIHTQAISRTTVPGQPGSTRIVSIRETKTTLESVDLDGVTLKTESTLGVGGKQIKSAPLTERFDFFQQPITSDVVVRNAGTGKLLVNQLVIPCKKRVYEKKNATEKLTTTLWFSTQLYPYVLRAETVLTALPTENEPMEFELRRTIFEVYESSAFLPRAANCMTTPALWNPAREQVTILIVRPCGSHL